jgi:hypothetical protein
MEGCILLAVGVRLVDMELENELFFGIYMVVMMEWSIGR